MNPLPKKGRPLDAVGTLRTRLVWYRFSSCEDLALLSPSGHSQVESVLINIKDHVNDRRVRTGIILVLTMEERVQR